MSVLTDIYRAPDDDPKVKDSHRVRAGRMLVDRITAMYPNAVLSAADGLVLSADYPENSQSVQDDDDEPFDKEVWDGIIAELKQLEEDGVITPDPNPPKLNYTYCGPPDDYVIPPEVAAEEAAKFRADIALRVERQKQWPEIEERRRKKLAQIYPSHSDDNDGEQPET